MPSEFIRCSPPQREMPRKVSAAAVVINSFSFIILPRNSTVSSFLLFEVTGNSVECFFSFLFFPGKKKADKERKSKGNKEVDKRTGWRSHHYYSRM